MKPASILPHGSLRVPRSPRGVFIAAVATLAFGIDGIRLVTK